MARAGSVLDSTLRQSITQRRHTLFGDPGAMQVEKLKRLDFSKHGNRRVSDPRAIQREILQPWQPGQGHQSIVSDFSSAQLDGFEPGQPRKLPQASIRDTGPGEIKLPQPRQWCQRLNQLPGQHSCCLRWC